MIYTGFLVYGSMAVIVSLVLVFYCGPRWGKKNMLVYITVCSLIGSISVVFTQGLGSAIVHSATKGNENQFKNWFIYVVLAIVIVTLIVEIVYLNKALNLFNTALVTPTYYVIFTTMTIVSSIVLYRGFDASPVDVITCVLGFLNICSGVALLHNSKSQPAEIESSASSKKTNDDEKVLLDDESVPTIRRKSVFQMFENDEATHPSDDHDDATSSGNHGSQDPGAADLFPAPFSGISRYASTTKRSQSILNKHRLNKSNTADTMPATVAAAAAVVSHSVRSRPHSNTISIGNTVTGEEGYNRELKWRDYNNNSATGPGQYHDPSHLQGFDDEDLKSLTTTITSNNTYGRSTTHRAQNELNPLSTFQLQIHGGEVDDRKGLVQPQDD